MFINLLAIFSHSSQCSKISSIILFNELYSFITLVLSEEVINFLSIPVLNASKDNSNT